MVQLSGPEKTRFVSRMFGRIAGRYDTGNRVLSLGRDQSWRRKTVAVLDPKPHETVLDIGGGTGDLSLALAKRAGKVIAVDFSRPMMLVGAAKTRKRALAGKVTFAEADALHLPFQSQTFEGIATAFTVRNLSRIEDGFAEMCRVLKPGGRLVVLEFTTPPSRIMRRLYRPYLKHLVPFVGGRITGDATAYRYLAASVAAFPTAQALAGLMREAGFPEVEWRFLNLGVVAIHVARKPGAPLPSGTQLEVCNETRG